MATIIKSGFPASASAEVQPVAFSMSDVTANAELYLEQVRRQATQILEKAKADADQLRKQAERDGAKTAVAVAEKTLRAALDPQLASVLKAMQDAVAQMHSARQAWLAQWEKNAVHLAAAIASRIVRGELTRNPEISLRLVREALELAAGSQRVLIRMNPRDHELLGSEAAQIARTLATAAPAELRGDPAVPVGGCIVTTEFGSIDNTIAAQLARLEEELI